MQRTKNVLKISSNEEAKPAIFVNLAAELKFLQIVARQQHVNYKQTESEQVPVPCLFRVAFDVIGISRGPVCSMTWQG